MPNPATGHRPCARSRTFTTRDGGVEDDDAIITRTANAVYVYLRPPTKTSVKPLLRDSRAMAAKICDIADCVDLVGAR